MVVERSGRVPTVPSDGTRQLGDGVLLVQVECRHRRSRTHLSAGGRADNWRPTDWGCMSNFDFFLNVSLLCAEISHCGWLCSEM